MKKITLLTILFLTAINAYSQNWHVTNCALITSGNTATLEGTFIWSANDTFQNDNHFARLVFALPPALVVAGSNATATINNVSIQGAYFTQITNSWTCEFGAGVSFAPNDVITFRVANLTVNNVQPFTGQIATHWIDFQSGPAETNYNDNYSSVDVTLFPALVVLANSIPLGFMPKYEDTSVVYSDYKLYPNPTDNALNVKVNVSTESVYQSFIYSTFGALVSKSKTVLKKGDNSISLDVSSLSNGMYYIKSTVNNQELAIQKIVVRIK